MFGSAAVVLILAAVGVLASSPTIAEDDIVTVERVESLSIESETVAALSGRCAPSLLSILGNPGDARAYVMVSNGFVPMPTPGPGRYASLEDAAETRCRELALPRAIGGAALAALGLAAVVMWRRNRDAGLASTAEVR